MLPHDAGRLDLPGVRGIGRCTVNALTRWVETPGNVVKLHRKKGLWRFILTRQRKVVAVYESRELRAALALLQASNLEP